ncbi:MAG: type IV pilus assembly protein PilM [Patescibacteria group bacterium]
MFTNPFPRAFGLDIGDLSIKIVQLERDSFFWRRPKFVLKAVRGIHLPYGLIVNGEVQKPEEVRHYIAKLLKGNGQKEKPVRSPWVLASLPETQGFIKLISLNKPDSEVIADDIIMESRKHLPYTEDDKYYLDWMILPTQNEGENKTKILIGAIPKNISDMYTYLLESLGLGVVGLEIEALSIVRSMVTAAKNYTGEARAILDIGATRTSFIVYDNDSVQFSTSIPFSGEVMNTAIVQNLKITYEKAEEMKKKYGLEYDKKSAAWAQVMRLIDQFVGNIEQAIQFYYSHFAGTNKINHITMCGGGANLKKLPEILATKLGVECAPGKPWKNVAEEKDIIPKFITENESTSYATAIGLGIRAADNFFRPNGIF